MAYILLSNNIVTGYNLGYGHNSNKGNLGKVGKISNFSAVGDGSDKGKVGKIWCRRRRQ